MRMHIGRSCLPVEAAFKTAQTSDRLSGKRRGRWRAGNGTTFRAIKGGSESGGTHLDVFLGIVPGTSCVGHGDSHLDAGNQGSSQQTGQRACAKQDSDDDWGEHDQAARGDHLREGCLHGKQHNQSWLCRYIHRTMMFRVSFSCPSSSAQEVMKSTVL